MFSIILDFKWHILLFAEIAGWVLTVLLFFARYLFRSIVFTWIFGVMIIVSDYFPSIMLPILDALYTDSFKEWVYGGGLLFNLVILTLFIISITVGKKFVLILDKKIMGFTNKVKNKAKMMVE